MRKPLDFITLLCAIGPRGLRPRKRRGMAYLSAEVAVRRVRPRRRLQGERLRKLDKIGWLRIKTAGTPSGNGFPRRRCGEI